jgi:hypothetical protein
MVVFAVFNILNTLFRKHAFFCVFLPIYKSINWTLIKTNAELETLIERENIVRFIKSQRLQWTAHVIRMDPLRTVKKLTDWNHVHQDQQESQG